MRTKPLLIVLSVMAALLVSAPTATAATEMSKQRAGHYFMRWGCPHSNAVDRLTWVLFRGKRVFHSDEITGDRLVKTRRAARRLSHVDFTAARRYSNPPAPWPTNVRQPVRRWTGTLVRYSDIFRNMGRATNGRQVVRAWNHAVDVGQRRGGTSTIRARLDLPAPGRGCGR